MPHRYAELTPDQLEQLILEGAPAVIPWGALEWHGAHLPLGLDGIVSEWFAAQLAEKTGGVLLPGIWLPITTLPHKLSQQVSTETLRMIVRELITGLADSGFETTIIITGHYAQGHMVELYRAAFEMLPKLRVFVATPLEPLAEEGTLDHAARYETSQLLAIRPDLVQMNRVPMVPQPRRDAILGQSPRHASAAEGEELFQRALAAWQVWLKDDIDALAEHYKKAEAGYQDYIDRYYKTSWEQAIQDWWATKSP